MKYHGRQKETDALGSTVDGPCQATSLAGEMEIKV